MKKRLMSAAIAAVVLMALFAACGEEVQTVANETAKQVGTITVTQLANNYYVVISWDAVEDGTGYSVYAQPEGKKTVIQLYSSSASNTNTYSNTDPVSDNYKSTPNSDIDKWNYIANVKYTQKTGSSSSPTITYPGDVPSGSVRFGVQTRNALPNHEYSEIKWSDYVTITAPADKDYTY